MKWGLWDDLAVCVSVYPPSLLGRGSVNTFPRQRIHTQKLNCWTRCFLCGLCRIKYSVCSEIERFPEPRDCKVWSWVRRNSKIKMAVLGKASSNLPDRQIRSSQNFFSYFLFILFNDWFLWRLFFWGWRQPFPPKCWCISTKLHGVTSQDTIITIITTVVASNLMYVFQYIYSSTKWRVMVSGQEFGFVMGPAVRHIWSYASGSSFWCVIICIFFSLLH
jgi:hypothetical protein